MPWNNNEKDQKLIYPTEFRLKTKFEFYGFFLDFTSVLTRVKSKNPLLDPFLNFCKKELMRPIIEILILFKRSKVDLLYYPRKNIRVLFRQFT